MKTVGDFYNAGLEFVTGDECDSSNGQMFSNAWVKYSNENDADFVNCTPTKFAWRENTGDKPSFTGVIEVKWSDGCVEVIFVNQVNDWGLNIEGDICVESWRPSLNQSAIQTETPEEKEAFNAMTESKPVFTQAMADAGELPPVGSRYTASSSEFTSVAHGNNAVDDALVGKTDSGFIWIHSQDECKPIKTEREKAIDEIQDVVCSQGFLSKMDVSFGIAEEIYNANYRKLTPSQAKAYDDKTEYFGEEYK